MHAAATVHVPVALHVSGSFIVVQLVVPAAHTPLQTPLMHVEFVHALPLSCHVPLAAHTCGCWPLHCTSPGAHEPEHAPITHVELVHGTALPQVPVDEHVWTPLPDAEH